MDWPRELPAPVLVIVETPLGVELLLETCPQAPFDVGQRATHLHPGGLREIETAVELLDQLHGQLLAVEHLGGQHGEFVRTLVVRCELEVDHLHGFAVCHQEIARHRIVVAGHQFQPGGQQRRLRHLVLGEHQLEVGGQPHAVFGDAFEMLVDHVEDGLGGAQQVAAVQDPVDVHDLAGHIGILEIAVGTRPVALEELDHLDAGVLVEVHDLRADAQLPGASGRLVGHGTIDELVGAFSGDLQEIPPVGSVHGDPPVAVRQATGHRSIFHAAPLPGYDRLEHTLDPALSFGPRRPEHAVAAAVRHRLCCCHMFLSRSK